MHENNKKSLSQTSEMMIGNVTYIVTSRFKEVGETAEDKLFRLVSARVSESIKSGNKAEII